MPRDHAIALAAESPTSSAPISPGPRVTPIRVTIAELDARLVERLLGRPGRSARGGDARRPRDDAAVARVELGLRGDDRRQHLPVGA